MSLLELFLWFFIIPLYVYFMIALFLPIIFKLCTKAIYEGRMQAELTVFGERQKKNEFFVSAAHYKPQKDEREEK